MIFTQFHIKENDQSLLTKVTGNKNNNNKVRKYWVDVQQGIVSSHGERDPLLPWFAILLEMVSR